jgi:hypothetical protein
MVDEIEAGRISDGVEFERKELYARYKASLDDASEEKLTNFSRRMSKFAIIFKIKAVNERRNSVHFTTLCGDLKTIVDNFRLKLKA